MEKEVNSDTYQNRVKYGPPPSKLKISKKNPLQKNQITPKENKSSKLPKKESLAGGDIDKKQKNKEDIKKVKYKYVGKASLAETLKKAVSKEFIPTKKSGYVLSIIFLAVVILALFKFPLGSLMSGQSQAKISVGIPWTFLEFDLIHPEEFPIRGWGLAGDLLIYILISYIIDVFLNLLLKSTEIIKKDKGIKPKVFKDKKVSSLAEKLAKKIVEKKEKKSEEEQEKESSTIEVFDVTSKPTKQKTPTKPVIKTMQPPTKKTTKTTTAKRALPKRPVQKVAIKKTMAPKKSSQEIQKSMNELKSIIAQPTAKPVIKTTRPTLKKTTSKKKFTKEI